jgi:hypothetical protein
MRERAVKRVGWDSVGEVGLGYVGLCWVRLG